MVDQKLVIVGDPYGQHADGHRGGSYLLRGDRKRMMEKYWKGDEVGIALPVLLAEGWRVAHMTGTGGNWLVLLERERQKPVKAGSRWGVHRTR
jgi:hypothetical protein